MIGLIVLFAFVVYLWLSSLVVWLAMRWAKRTGRSARRWGIAAGLFMYLLVFWDHIPTLVLHKYYCATKAGFWVYKTPEQWKAENPGVAETLTWREKSQRYQNADGSWGFKLNERFVWEHQQPKSLVLPVNFDIESIIDTKDGNIMIRRVTVWSGYGNFALGGTDWKVLKFWVKAETCRPNILGFSQYLQSFEQIGRKSR